MDLSEGTPAWEPPLYLKPRLAPLEQWFSNPHLLLKIIWGFVKTQILGRTPEFLTQQVWGGVQDCISKFPMMLMILLLDYTFSMGGLG